MSINLIWLKARPTTVLAAVIAVVAALSGDAAMLLVVGLARYLAVNIYIQWLISASIIAVGSYLFFGLTQIKAWERDELRPPIADDFRTRWSLRLLGQKSTLTFLLASLIGGPLAVGYASGYTHSTDGRKKTFISACILAAFWSAFYLGAVYWAVQLLGRSA